jgi:parvulin-like peptidyl-prolyl isomerase
MRTPTLALVVWALVAGGSPAQSGDQNQILAKVNKEIITRRDVERELGPYLQALRTDELKSPKERQAEEFRALMTKLRQMVYEELTRQLGEEAGITVPEGYVEGRIREEAEQLGRDEDSGLEGLPRLLQVLRDRGMNLDEFRAAMESDYVVREVLLSQAGLRPDKGIALPPLDTYVGPQEMYAYYTSHRTEFQSESGIKASMILLKGRKGRARRDAERRAQEVHRAALAGRDFSQLARQHSDSTTGKTGGKLAGGEWSPRGQLSKEIEEVIWSLPAGGISDVVEGNLGYYIFRVDARQDATVAPFSEVQGKIRARLQNQRLQENIERIQKRLLEVAYVWPETLFRSK